MDKEMRKMFRSNVIKLSIGSVLLAVSFVYLQNHPAERVSVLSGFEVMYQKINIFYHDIVNREDSKILKEKYTLQKYYGELLRMAEHKDCISTGVVGEIKDITSNIKNSSLEEFSDNLADYTRKVYKYDAMVKKECN